MSHYDMCECGHPEKDHEEDNRTPGHFCTLCPCEDFADVAPHRGSAAENVAKEE